MSENRYINPATTKKCRICRIFLQDLQVLQDFAGFCRIYRFLQESQDCGMPGSANMFEPFGSIIPRFLLVFSSLVIFPRPFGLSLLRPFGLLILLSTGLLGPTIPRSAIIIGLCFIETIIIFLSFN